MSIFASILRSVYKLSGAKKAFALPEDALRKEIEKQNRHRGVFTPTDRKAYYETIAVNGFLCLIVREHPKPSERAILYFFGGGMVIGPDKGDLPVMRKLCRETGCAKTSSMDAVASMSFTRFGSSAAIAQKPW